MKSKQLYGFAILGFSIGIGASLTAHAGVLIEFVNRNATTGKEEPLQSMMVQNGVARMESSRGKSHAVTLFKDDALYMLDDAAKTYRVMDKATMEQTANMMGDAMAKMREQMAKMPPEQRAMMEQMMKQRGGAMGGAMMGNSAPQKPIAYDAQPTGGNQTIEGKSCKLWNVSRDGVLSQQLCVVPIAAMPGADEVIGLSKKIAALFEKMTAQLRDQMPDTQQSSATLTKINGYPIMTRGYRDGVLQPEQFIVKTWKQQSIDAAKFEVPAGYTKQEMPVLKK